MAQHGQPTMREHTFRIELLCVRRMVAGHGWKGRANGQAQAWMTCQSAHSGKTDR